MNLKLIIRIGINTLIGGVLIYLWFKFVDVKEVFKAISGVSPLAVGVAFTAMVLSGLSKAVRLYILVSGEYKIPLLKIIYLNMLSQLLSFTIPIRAGEIAKGVYLSTEYKIPIAKSIVLIFLDRFLDFWMVIVLTFLLLFLIPTNLPANFTPVLAAAGIIFSAVVLSVVFLPEFFRKLVKFFSNFLVINVLKKFFVKFAEFVIESVQLLKGGVKRNSLLGLFTFLGILFEGFAWFSLLSFYIARVDFFKALLGSMLNALTFLIPSAPGYVGSAEAAGLAVFTFGLGFDKLAVS